MASSILIVSFYYPPYPKVGSRRWVKFAKYLHRKGKKIRVLAAQMDVDSFSPWDADAREIEHLTTRIHLKYNAPYYKTTLPGNVFSKVRWLASLKLDRLSLKFNKGNPNDQSQKYAPAFLESIRAAVEKEKTDTLIFTANPFHLACHISTLKKEYPHIKFVFDLRDYWSDRTKHLANKIFEYEKKCEAATISNADVILTPADKISSLLKKRYTEKAPAIFTIPHSFDEDDSAGIQPGEKQADGKINLVYAGTLYDHMEANFEVLRQLLAENDNVFLSIYSPVKRYGEYFAGTALESRVAYHNQVPLQQLVKIIAESAAGWIYMFNNNNDDCDFFTTKYFDYLPSRQPVIYIGKEGMASKHIVDNGIGIHLKLNNTANFEQALAQLAHGIRSYDFKQFSFNNSTDKLIAILES